MTVTLRGGATGSFFTAHDARYQYAADLDGGTFVGNAGNPAAISYRSMAAAGTTTVAGAFAIDLQWRAVALRWAWLSVSAGSGTVAFRVRYGLWYPLLGGTGTNLSLTTITPAAEAKDMVAGGGAYSLPTETAAIATPPDGFLGTSPIMSFSIDRLGDSDTLASVIGLTVATITRVD